MRAVIRRFDSFLRRANHVFELDGDQTSVMRLQVTHAQHALELPNGTHGKAGDRVILLHLANERVPPLPPEGPDLNWALRMHRDLVCALRLIAQHMQIDPRLADIHLVGGISALISYKDKGAINLMEHLGFMVMPYHSPLGRFGEFWENFYSWWLMWAFNTVSLRHRTLMKLQRTEIWMSTQELLRRYGIK